MRGKIVIKKQTKKRNCLFAAFLILFCLSLSLSLQGCLSLMELGLSAVSMIPESGKSPIEPERQERVFSTDFNHTWKVLVKSMSELNIPIVKESKTNGLMVTDSIPIEKKVFGEQILFEGFGERVETGRYKIQVAINSVEDGSTQVKFKPIIEKYVQYPNSNSLQPQWKLQESNGIIEQVLFQTMFEKFLKGQKILKTVSLGTTKEVNKIVRITLEKFRILNVGLALDFAEDVPDMMPGYLRSEPSH